MVGLFNQDLNNGGVVKSPISFVVGFYQNLNIPHVWLRAWLKHYASYIELFNLAIYRFGWPFYETVNFDGVVKSPIYFVVGFYQNLNIPLVWLRAR